MIILQVELSALHFHNSVISSAEQFSYKSLTFVAFGLDEQDGFGNPWEDFCKDCHGMSYFDVLCTGYPYYRLRSWEFFHLVASVRPSVSAPTAESLDLRL